MSEKVIVTGFEPFGGEKENPTRIIAENINGKNIAGKEIEGILLPVSVKRTAEALLKILQEKKPDILILTGLNGRINDINLERVAINVIDARIPDNDGVKPVDQIIVEHGENAYFSTLPIREIMNKLHENKIPASISNSAGTYLCNYSMYLALNYAKQNGYPKKSGFIHVPFLYDQVLDRAQFSGMSKEHLIDSIDISVKTAIEF